MKTIQWIGPYGCLQNISLMQQWNQMQLQKNLCLTIMRWLPLYLQKHAAHNQNDWLPGCLKQSSMTIFQKIWTTKTSNDNPITKQADAITSKDNTLVPSLQADTSCAIGLMHIYPYSRKQPGTCGDIGMVSSTYNSNALPVISTVTGTNEQDRLSPIIPYSKGQCMQRFHVSMVYSWQQQQQLPPPPTTTKIKEIGCMWQHVSKPVGPQQC